MYIQCDIKSSFNYIQFNEVQEDIDEIICRYETDRYSIVEIIK